MNKKIRGAKVRQKKSQSLVTNSKSSLSADAGLSQNTHSENMQSSIEDDIQGFEESLGTDLDSVLGDTEFSLEEAPTLEDLLMSEDSLVDLYFKGQPDNLATPAPRAGYVQYNFNVLPKGKPNHTEIQKAKIMGYAPRLAKTLSESEKRRFRCEQYGGDSIIRIGEGYVLYECRTEVADMRLRQTKALTDRMTLSADKDFQEVPGYTKVERSVRDEVEEFGGRRRVMAAPDRF